MFGDEQFKELNFEESVNHRSSFDDPELDTDYVASDAEEDLLRDLLEDY
jgi:hypothetical protein